MSKMDSAFLEATAEELGIELIGVANITQERQHFEHLPGTLLDKMTGAIVLAKRVSPTVLSTVEDGPSLIYLHHYRQLNSLLNHTAEIIAGEIEAMGAQALAIPASQIVDWQRPSGHLSHKKLAWLAGLGWRGRNNLLVTKKWGAQVRLASVLTNLPLTPARPLDSTCGDCRRCLDVCPAGAIKQNPLEFDLAACFAKLREFRKTRGVGQYICGLCVKACTGEKGK